MSKQTKPNQYQVFLSTIHNNLKFKAIPNSIGDNKKDISPSAKLEVNYEDAAVCCLIESMYQMKDFYENIIEELTANGAPPVITSIINRVAEKHKVLEFIKEVS